MEEEGIRLKPERPRSKQEVVVMQQSCKQSLGATAGAFYKLDPYEQYEDVSDCPLVAKR